MKASRIAMIVLLGIVALVSLGAIVIPLLLRWLGLLPIEVL